MPKPRAYRDKLYQLLINPTTDITEIAVQMNKIAQKTGVLRWAGIGDMFSSTVEALYYCLQTDDNIIHWVVTRKPNIIQELHQLDLNQSQLDRLFVTFSVDATQESVDKLTKLSTMKLYPRMSFAFVRDSLQQLYIPSCATIFNQHQKKKELATKLSSHNYYCPCDLGILQTKDACLQCRHCFNGSTLKSHLSKSKILKLKDFIVKEIDE